MRRFLGLHVAVALPLLLITGLAMALGNANDSQSRSPVGLGASCALPCWRGIQPGEIFIAQANRILIGQGYTARNFAGDINHIQYLPPHEECAVRLQHIAAIVIETRFLSCPDLRVGDVVAALGRPHSLAANFVFYRYDKGIISVRLRPRSCTDTLSPRTQVSYISLTIQQPPLVGQIRWQGFAPNWRYFQTAPHVPPLAC